MDYEWDDAKASANRRKHGVAFEDAILALQDPYRIEDLDGRFIYDDLRMQVIGMSHNRVLFVVTTQRSEDRCRIISARKATRYEQNRYYAGDSEDW